MPENYQTGIEYRGLNKLILLFDDFTDKRYLTAKQIQKLWWSIKKWEKATRIIYWQYKDQDEDELSYPIIKYYNVFNIEQVQWIEITLRKSRDITDRSNKAMQVVHNYKDKPDILPGVNPCYIPYKDTIEIPSMERFKTVDEYYSTLYHELIHSTWHTTRLSRFTESVKYFWSEEYSFEELIAEIWSLFLSQEAGIIQKTKENSLAYIQGWLKYLKNNKKQIVYASALAQKATDYILQREELY